MTQGEIESDHGAKTTVQSTASGKLVCEKLQKLGYFEDAQDAFRFAVCYALANELRPEEKVSKDREGKGFTWSVTGLDPNQALRILVSEFAIESRPANQRDQYNQIEILGNLGLEEIGRRIDSGDYFSELIV